MPEEENQTSVERDCKESGGQGETPVEQSRGQHTCCKAPATNAGWGHVALDTNLSATAAQKQPQTPGSPQAWPWAHRTVPMTAVGAGLPPRDGRVWQREGRRVQNPR